MREGIIYIGHVKNFKIYMDNLLEEHKGQTVKEFFDEVGHGVN